MQFFLISFHSSLFLDNQQINQALYKHTSSKPPLLWRSNTIQSPFQEAQNSEKLFLEVLLLAFLQHIRSKWWNKSRSIIQYQVQFFYRKTKFFFHSLQKYSANMQLQASQANDENSEVFLLQRINDISIIPKRESRIFCFGKSFHISEFSGFAHPVQPNFQMFDKFILLKASGPGKSSDFRYN